MPAILRHCETLAYVDWAKKWQTDIFGGWHDIEINSYRNIYSHNNWIPTRLHWIYSFLFCRLDLWHHRKIWFFLLYLWPTLHGRDTLSTRSTVYSNDRTIQKKIHGWCTCVASCSVSCKISLGDPCLPHMVAVRSPWHRWEMPVW